MSSTPSGGVAGALHALARWLGPSEHAEWIEAMRAESPYLPESARLRWAIGCLFAAIKLRFTPMQTGSMRINPWVMVLESLVCFVPSIMFWWFVTFGDLGVFRHGPAEFERAFAGEPNVKWLVAMIYGFAVCGLIGPTGLFLGLRYAVLRRGLSNRVLGFGLIAAAVAWGLAFTPSHFWMGKSDLSERLTAFVFGTVLPVACILHLMYLARPAASGPADARLAPG